MGTPIDEFRDPFENRIAAPAFASQLDITDAVRTMDGEQISATPVRLKEKKRVGFSGNVPSLSEDVPAQSSVPRIVLHTDHTTPDLADSRSNVRVEEETSYSYPEDPIATSTPRNGSVPDLRPRPAILKPLAARAEPPLRTEDASNLLRDDPPARQAFEKAKRLEKSQQDMAGKSSGASSPIDDEFMRVRMQEVDTDSDNDFEPPALVRARHLSQTEAYGLVKRHTKARSLMIDRKHTGHQSGAVTPTEDLDFIEEYAPPPDKYRGGVLGALLNLYNQSSSGHHSSGTNTPVNGSRRNSIELNDHSGFSTPQHSPPSSGTVTPNGSRHWYSFDRNSSSVSLNTLVGAQSLSQKLSQTLKQSGHASRPKLGKRTSSVGSRFSRRARQEQEIKITYHIQAVLLRQRYLLELCRALMMYGAPTHRLEEYMRMSARVLEIDASFLYIPGAMIISFEDLQTHTSEVKLVRVLQGLNLGKLREVHDVYKNVVHDRTGVEEARDALVNIQKREQLYKRWLCVLAYAMASLSVGPFAFGAQWIDLPISFFLGFIVGVLQIFIAPRSELFANVIEVAAAVITSFLARAFGSIYRPKESPNDPNVPYFCFAASAQSAIALILPGYLVLCASLELQSKSIVAGSVRMVYAIIYSLFLGYGITIGTAIYGVLDANATSEVTCSNPLSWKWNYLFVAMFTICLCVVNQARFKQMPSMLIISLVGYIVNYWSARRFPGNAQVSNTLGAFAIGVLANLYSRLGGPTQNKLLDIYDNRIQPALTKLRCRFRGSAPSPAVTDKDLEDGVQATKINSATPTRTRRIGYSLAAAAMLPAIFVQVPSGLAVQGSLISGLAGANAITSHTHLGSGGLTSNGTSTTTTTSGPLDSTAFNVSFSVIQVAIGITVGLFLSAIVIYPFGKRRSGLFSF